MLRINRSIRSCKGLVIEQLLKLFAIKSTSVRGICTFALKSSYKTNLHATHLRKLITNLLGVRFMRSDSEIIALAWDDKTSFEMIEDQTGL